MNKATLAISLLLSAGLIACGGGGSDSTPAAGNTPTPVSTFALQAGYRALVSQATSTNFTNSGTCTGTTSATYSALSASTFEGALAQSKTTTISGTYTNCLPASFASTQVSYFDSNFVPLGTSSPNSFGKFLVAPPQLPTSVKIGDTSVYGTETLYANSSKTTPIGRNDLSYVIEADGVSNSSAIANLITKNYNQSNQPLFTEQARYRIVADGTLTPLSRDIQYSTTSTAHQLLIAN